METGRREITVIPPTINPVTRMPNSAVIKRRVAGYARVSTDSDEQFTSYAAQVDYYTSFIKSHAEWEFVKVYTDEGISGTNTIHRDGFNKMIKDALDGKIDLIVTKSVSRFARNTVDSLVTVRKLKEKGIEIFFEKENIYTLDSKGELLITLMPSLAQEESRSISENVTWGQRKRFADGKVNIPYKRFLGYRKGDNGLPEIVPEEAKTIRHIYNLFMKGSTTTGIAKQLTEEGILTPGGKPNWRASTVQSILTNEKYKGDALLQKKFTVDFLTKKMKTNEGEVPQYYVENSHPAIIPPHEWDLVQSEIERRKGIGREYSGTSIFSTRIICADCGSYYGRKVWHSTDKYRKIIWRCNHKFDKDKRCSTPAIEESQIEQGFIQVVNQLLESRESVIEDCNLIRETIFDCNQLKTEMKNIDGEMQDLADLIRIFIDENSRQALNQSEYLDRYNTYVARYEALSQKYDELAEKRNSRKLKADAIDAFIYCIKQLQEPITDFDEKLWLASIDKVMVQKDGSLRYILRTGAEFLI